MNVPRLEDTERRPFDVLVADCPWPFDDHLSSSATRSAAANYSTMHDLAIARLEVSRCMAADAACWLWVISSKLQVGLDVLHRWGFEHKQVVVWVKTSATTDDEDEDASLCEPADLAFGMGRMHRSCKELVLVGTRGNPYKMLAARNVRDVLHAPPGKHAERKHSAKPEGLQDRIDKMFPNAHRLEMFARRHRPGWTCIGNEAPQTRGQDIRASLRFLAAHVATPW